jgi:hypothetical protein
MGDCLLPTRCKRPAPACDWWAAVALLELPSSACDGGSRGTCNEAEFDKMVAATRACWQTGDRECNRNYIRRTVLICISNAGCTRPSHHIEPPGQQPQCLRYASLLVTARLHTNPTLDVFARCRAMLVVWSKSNRRHKQQAVGDAPWERDEWRREAADWL